MTIEYTAFAIGAFLIAVFLIWKKLRFIDTRLTEMRDELNELHTIESRLFMMALNANPKLEACTAVPQNEAAETSGGDVVSKDHEQTPPQPGQEHALGSDLVAVVPTSEQEGGRGANQPDGRKPLQAWPRQKSDP
jgi:hypothetical protein